MAGGPYKYDVADLGEAASGLRTLQADYEGATRSRRGASADLGYSSLRSAMQEFVDDWEHNRDRQLEEIEATATALGQIIDDYVSHDADGAAELRG